MNQKQDYYLLFMHYLYISNCCHFADEDTEALSEPFWQRSLAESSSVDLAQMAQFGDYNCYASACPQLHTSVTVFWCQLQETPNWNCHLPLHMVQPHSKAPRSPG